MKRIVILLLGALAALSSATAQELPGAVTKKFIAFGWEFGFYNDPAFLLENADLFASTGIDGVGLYPSKMIGGRSKTYSVLNDPEWKREDFAHQIPLYRQLTQKKGFQHSFLKAFHAPTTSSASPVTSTGNACCTTASASAATAKASASTRVRKKDRPVSSV